MKRKLDLFIILLIGFLALCIAFVSCGDTPSGSDDEHHLTYWAFVPGGAGHATITDIINDFGWPGTTRVGSETDSPAWVSGSTATAIYDWCVNEPLNYDLNGTIVGSFEQVLNFTMNGITCPPALKTALNSNKGNVPLTAIFKVPDGLADPNTHIIFYIQKN